MREKQVFIEAGRTEKHYWQDLWRYRELFYILAWRDIKVRYKQTALGAAWSILRPLLTTGVFTLVFGRIAGLPGEGNAPYALLVYAAMLPWQFFSNALSESSNSLIGNANLITKVYFPRMIVPTGAVITALVDFALALIILPVLLLFYRFTPSWHLVFLPIFMVLVFFTAFGAGLYLTALNVRYRHERYLIPFIVQFGLFISPVGFSSSVAPAHWRRAYNLNPMVGIIDGFRWCLLPGAPVPPERLAFSIVLTVLVTWLGVYYFRRMEKAFADTL
ncbi:MAG: ABC transporter permease [Saprospiraceae bacterium]